MKVSYNWLNSYFENKLPEPGSVVEKIIEHSFEVEALEKIGEDYLVDIDVLPNRAHDAISHIGIAKDLAVIYDHELKLPNLILGHEGDFNTEDYVDVGAADSKLVPRVTTRVVTGIKIGKSPQWLVDRLATLGQKSINNIVDITNYVMFETGQPVHAFDYDKISGVGPKKFELRFAKHDEPLKLLDGTELKLDSETLVWADSEKPLDIAGIKGGANSGVDEKTTAIVLSICNFEAINIRKTRQRHRIVTDASKRFEHSLSPELAGWGMKRTSDLISEIVEGKLGTVSDIYPSQQKDSKAQFKTSQLNKILGVDLSEKEVEEILNRLKHAGFGWGKSGEEYEVSVPAERLDVRELHEIIEEIGRFYGYRNIQATLPDKNDFKPKVHKYFYYSTLIKNKLITLGFSEVYSYVMSDKGDVEISNSLVKGMEFLRSEMHDSMEVSLEKNIRNIDLLGLDQIKIFEVGKVFKNGKEYWGLCLGVRNKKGFKKTAENESLEEARIALETLLQTSINTEIRNGIMECDIEELLKELPVPDSYDLGMFMQNQNTVFRPFSYYPFISRDIALWVNDDTNVEQVTKIIKDNSGGLLVTEPKLFDEFSKDDKKSLAFRFVFQAMDRTLTDEEVNQLMEKIYTKAREEGWEVR